MKIFLITGLKSLKTWLFFLIFLNINSFSYQASSENNEPLSFVTTGPNKKEAVGFLTINKQLESTWALLCPLVELLADEHVKAVVLHGLENINITMAWPYLQVLQDLKRMYQKPIIVYEYARLRGGNSYIMACGADAIVVAPWVKVESIEYFLNYRLSYDQDKKDGSLLNYIYSGKFKDDNVHLPFKAEWQKRAETFVHSSFDVLVHDIIAQRPPTGLYKDKWIHGEQLSANQALAYGLIDGICDRTSLISYALNFAGLPNRNVVNVDLVEKKVLEGKLYNHKVNTNQSTTGIIKIQNLPVNSWEYTSKLLKLFQDPTIDKIVLDITVASDAYLIASNLHYDIVKLKQIYKKPVVAYLEVALKSAGYYLASAADYIIASSGILIGGIGASYERWDFTQQQKNEHLKYSLTTTGKFVNLFNTNVALDAAGKEIIQKQINFDHAKIIYDIKLARPVLKNVESSLWGEGQLFIAHDALKYGLIDMIGTPLDALNFGNPNPINKIDELNFIVENFE